MNIVPVMLIKNEEYWIENILTPLIKNFEHVIVADTGSTDATLKIIGDMRAINVEVFAYKSMTPQEIGQCRGWMQERAEHLFGATHILLVDGDELYPSKYLKHIVDNPMPEDALSGFTWGIECTELPNGECWMYEVGCNRQAIISVDSIWRGQYPFESPSTYIPGDQRNHYFKSPDDTHHFYHLHHMPRSSRDEDVYLRVQKRHQFSMQDHPEIRPHKFWLANRSEYKDE